MLKHNYDKRFNIFLQPPKDEHLALNNFWFCGFIEADGCFNITIRKCSTSTTKIRVDLRLTIAQKDNYLLKQIQQKFTTAQIYESKNTKTPHFRITISGYKRVPTIISYFDKYPLQTCKYVHYRMFRRCFRFMQLKKHFDFKGLQQVKAMQKILTSVYKKNNANNKINYS